MAMDVMKMDLPDEDATLRLGRALGRCATAGTVLTLSGDLGAARRPPRAVSQRDWRFPGSVSRVLTYMLMQLHEGGRLPLSHFDAWMEGREKALLADGADEFLASDGVAVIEWAERVEEWLPEERIGLDLLRSGGGRGATLIAVGEAHKRVLEYGSGPHGPRPPGLGWLTAANFRPIR